MLKFICYSFFGDLMKKALIMFLMAVAIGGGIAYFIFNKVVIKEESIDSLVAKAFQVGAFTNYDNALRVADRNNGIVVSDGDIFRVYVAILYNDVAIDKLKVHYDNIGLSYYLKDVVVSSEFVSNIKSSEELLIESNTDTYSVINLSVLNMYEEVL